MIDESIDIVVNPDLLSEEYLPPDIPGREPHIKDLQACISPALKKQKPIHSWLYGSPGTGKTTTARFILRKLEQEASIKGIYINCWENNSFYSVLDFLVRELRIFGAEKLSTAFKLERLADFLQDKPMIIVLDEVDQLPKRERDSILYSMCALKNVGLCCICNSKYVLFSLDDRIKSRLNAERLEFLPYGADDIGFILGKRAELSLRPGSWSKQNLLKISELAEGDARVAIQTMKNAAYQAERNDSEKILDKHIMKGWNSAKDLKRTYLLNKLTEHHKLLYDIVKEKKGIKSGLLWNIYLERCKRKNAQPIALRTFSEYKGKLS